jgi:L,D-peptidoglycan transpeptidase YkuD (ErfK/YbiS/YcfS/YnhG family)
MADSPTVDTVSLTSKRTRILAGLAAAGLLTGGCTSATTESAHAVATVEPTTQASTTTAPTPAHATHKPKKPKPKAPDRQLVTVTAASYAATHASFAAYQRENGKWVKVLGPWTASIGKSGMAPPGKKREGDGRTPSGTYGFGFFFGAEPDPGVSFPYRRAHSYDRWDDDSSSPLYNEWVDDRTHNPGAAPEAMDDPPYYDYGAVIAYNTARTPGKGSAIFLHVDTGAPTVGCVTLPTTELLKVLKWLRPAADPRITMRAA